MLLTPVEIRDSVWMALGSIRANKFRATLTILGVMIGVSSVIGLASIIRGLDGAVEKSISDLGSNSIYVTRFAFNQDWDNLTEEERNRPPITVGEAKAILDNCPSVTGVSPQNYYFRPGGNIVKFRNQKANQPRVMGTWPAYISVNNSNLSKGRFISEADNQQRAMVCVIGADIADGLFGQGGYDAIGQEIRVNGYRLRVIGVFERREGSLGDENRENQLVAMPLSVFEKMYPWEEELFLAARAASYETIGQAKEEIINALRVYRKVPYGKENNFAISTQDTFRDQYAKVSKYIYIAMMVITSVGLMVGGIGVMNIMLVSVTERTREIGVRKAIGAKRSNIILQFLTEAITLSGFGGVVGIFLGVIVGLGLNWKFHFPLGVSLFWIAVGFIVAVSVGLVSGIYPAMRAAKLDPIEALRYE